ncbi:YdeI/OmpD-associated family protein [Variovorax rhizosphaerae]|uniref:YdeI/OmpD-associated family protein n=1 Tax=Variovorax rhizosphaerae TaxID=1836200 RepID=UPI003BF50CE8
MRCGTGGCLDTAVIQDEPILECASAAKWAAWLRRHHAKSTGVWLRLSKKGADRATLTYAEALDLALCHGWIDARSQSEGEHYWLKRFTPRASRSIWSKINCEKAMKLVQAGRMQPAGQSEIDRAKADGRWDAAYDGARASTIPPDLQAALDAEPRAAAFFATLDSTNRYAVLFRTQTAKKPETRAKRIAQFVAMLARGEKLHN